MNKDNIISLTNKISLVSIILLIYWVFIFILHVVFEFKVFRENITQSFSLSILAILALLIGAVIVNVMFNMTKISEALNERVTPPVDASSESKKKRTFKLVLFILSLPLIFLILYLGDMRTSKVREMSLADSAKFMVMNNQTIIEMLADYNFNKEYMTRACSSLQLLSKEDESFPSVSLITRDAIEDKEVFLKVGGYCSNFKNLKKINYIYSSSKEERQYFNKVLNEGREKYMFSSNDGFYELYYPVRSGDKTLIIYFTDKKRYGKYGS